MDFLGGSSSRHLHHEGRRSKLQNRHRRHHVAHTTQAHGSDHNGSLAVRPTRDEYAHDGGKRGLVNTWLEDIETPHLQPLRNKKSPPQEGGRRTRSRPESTYRPRSPSPSKLFSYDGGKGQTFSASPRQKLRERKRPRDLVQRSPILDLCDEQHPIQTPPVSRPGLVATELNHDSSKERSFTGSEGSVVSALSGREDRFAKKARHRTRTDRYENKDRKPRKPRKPGKRKRKNPGDRGKTNYTKRGGDFSSAREVMDSFNSKSILSDRITMQPTVRPGLFDNGRTSQDQLSDLTFHEMHFLKGPLPSKPILRDRERAKRRGERELEEVSAFFLHKGMPEASGASGRDHRPISGASSLDRATRGSSAFSLEAPSQRPEPGEECDQMSPEVERESSRATNWTWSSSHAGLEQGITQATRSREHVPARTPTPSPSRNAFRRTKTLDKTGLSCVERSRQVPSATPRPKHIRSPRAPLAVASSDFVNHQPYMTGQNVRIVRYHDRGVMASEGAESTAESRQKGTGARSDSVEQPWVKLPAESPAPVNVVKRSRFEREGERAILSHEEGQACEATGFHTTDHDSGPDRPRSPKCTMIERLEAAARTAESQELLNDLATGIPSLPVQQDGQAATSAQDHNIAVAHSPCQDGHFEIRPHLFGDRHQGQLEAVQESEDFHTIHRELRDGQRAHEGALAPHMESRHRTVNPHRVSILEQPAHGVRSAHRVPFGAHPMARSTLENHSAFQVNSPHRAPGSQTAMNNWAATGHGQVLSDQFLYRTHSVLPEAAKISLLRSDRKHDLEEYITEMENEVFSRPQDAADDDSPNPGPHAMEEDQGLCREFIPQSRQLNVDSYYQDLSGDGHLKDESIGASYYGGGSAVQDPEVDQEEQKFMSTFWRPHYS